MSLPCRTIAAALAVLVAPASAHAAARVWVSAAKGVDTATCAAVATPCRTLAQAHANVDAGGEIDILDPGGYGAVTITKAVSIVNDGVGTGGALSTAGDAIFINATMTDDVVLKGLSIDGGGTGINGVRAVGARNVTLLNCTIKGFASGVVGTGVLLAPTGGTMTLTMVDTTVTGSAKSGLMIAPTGSVVVKFDLQRDVLTNNGSAGIWVEATGSAASVSGTIQDSLVSGAFDGVYGKGRTAVTNVANNVVMTLSQSTVSHNQHAIRLDTGASAYLSNSVVSENPQGAFFNVGGSLSTYKNNIIRANGAGDPMTPITPGD